MADKVLSGHTSAETAYVVADYPYGFRLRCQIRYWVETKPGHGQRVVSQTTNPKVPGTVWNKPKTSTYSDLRVLFLDENGHVQNDALNFYADSAQVAVFAEQYRDALIDEWSQKTLRVLRHIAAKQEAK